MSIFTAIRLARLAAKATGFLSGTGFEDPIFSHVPDEFGWKEDFQIPDQPIWGPGERPKKRPAPEPPLLTLPKKRKLPPSRVFIPEDPLKKYRKLPEKVIVKPQPPVRRPGMGRVYTTPTKADQEYFRRTGKVPHKRFLIKTYKRGNYMKRKGARSGGYLQQEKKFATFEYDGSVPATIAGSEASPPTEGSLTSIAAGDGPTNRDGRHVEVVGIYIRGYILFGADPASAGQPLGDHVRLLVVLDEQTNGAALNAEDVLAETADTDLDSLAFRNLEYTGRFRVLKDITIRRPYMAMTGTVATPSYAASGVTVPFKINLPMAKKPLKINYTSTTAVIANCVDNSIHMIAIAVRSTNTLRYVCRTRFVG